MTMLFFEHEGWEVVTSSWTAAAKPDRKVEVCYSWGADQVSFFASATAVRRVILDMSMTQFLKAVARGGVIDLR